MLTLRILLPGPGEVVRINTGAPVPPGADAVVMVEDTKLVSVNRYRYREQGSRICLKR